MNDPASFGQSFQKFMNSMSAAVPEPENHFRARFEAHLGTDPLTLPIVSHKFPAFEHPNVHLALDELLAQRKEVGETAESTGFTSPHKRYGSTSLSDLLSNDPHTKPTPGPVEYKSFLKADGNAIACVNSGILLLGGPKPVVVLVNGPSSREMEVGVEVEVMAATRADAESFLQQVRSRASSSSVYRGHSLVIESSYRGTSVRFHPLPKISRDSIILDEHTLARIERQTISFSVVAQELLAAGRHLKRGILLHGPPGTGKTLSAMYLASRMEGRTVLLTSGLGLGSIAQVCAFARALQPSTVILEDVDLIAEDRESQGQCAMPLLFELLNQMDGLNEDADILFVLTTNRPQALESALSARPGRIDQAIEVPLPDAVCRRRLIELYARGIKLDLSSLDSVIDRTTSASAAFIRELLRRATLLAIIDGKGSVVGPAQIDEALRELTLSGALTGKLLGFTHDEQA